jgi:hypothetical protein
MPEPLHCPTFYLGQELVYKAHDTGRGGEGMGVRRSPPHSANGIKTHTETTYMYIYIVFIIAILDITSPI